MIELPQRTPQPKGQPSQASRGRRPVRGNLGIRPPTRIDPNIPIPCRSPSTDPRVSFPGSGGDPYVTRPANGGFGESVGAGMKVGRSDGYIYFNWIDIICE